MELGNNNGLQVQQGFASKQYTQRGKNVFPSLSPSQAGDKDARLRKVFSRIEKASWALIIAGSALLFLLGDGVNMPELFLLGIAALILGATALSASRVIGRIATIISSLGESTEMVAAAGTIVSSQKAATAQCDALEVQGLERRNAAASTAGVKHRNGVLYNPDQEETSSSIAGAIILGIAAIVMLVLQGTPFIEGMVLKAIMFSGALMLGMFSLHTVAGLLYKKSRARNCTELELAYIKYHDIEETEAEARRSLMMLRVGEQAVPQDKRTSSVIQHYSLTRADIVKKLNEALARKEQAAQRIQSLGGQRPAPNRAIEEAPETFLAERAESRPLWFRIILGLECWGMLIGIAVFLIAMVFAVLTGQATVSVG